MTAASAIHFPSGSSGIQDVPGSWPFLGHIVPMVRRPLKFLPSVAEYGDVVRIRFGRLPIYVATHPNSVRDVLVPGDIAYTRGRIFEKLEPGLGKGIATVSGPEHRRQRRLLQPVFTHERLAEYATIMRTAAEEAVESWQDGQVLAVDEVMNDLALTALTRSLFKFTATPDTAQAIHHGMRSLTRGLLIRTVLPTAWERVPTPGNIRFRRAMAKMHAAIDEVIAEYREAARDRGDVLSALLSVRDESSNALADEEIHAQMMTLALTGIEAPGAALGWVMYEIGRNPEVAKRVQTEIDTLLDGRPPQFDDLPALSYLDRVITEVLRLRTPLIFMRRTLTDVRVGGSTIPGGSEVIYSPYLLHHDARWFPDPLRFDPDRWLPENAQRIPKGAFVAFAAGAYQCIGKQFATTELAMVAAVICSRWRLRVVPGVPVREIATALVRPSALPMSVHRRAHFAYSAPGR